MVNGIVLGVIFIWTGFATADGKSFALEATNVMTSFMSSGSVGNTMFLCSGLGGLLIGDSFVSNPMAWELGVATIRSFHQSARAH